MKMVWSICFLNINVDWKPVFTVFLFTLLIAGCASLGGTYPEDKGDICAEQRGNLRRTEDYFVKQGVENVLGGAAIGAVSGAIISAISGGNIGKDAAIGAIAGGGAGLIKTLYESMNSENQQIDLATNAFNNLNQCRLNAANRVRSDFSSKRITKQVALNKMTDLKMRFNEDVMIAKRIGAKISERSIQFQNELVKEDPSVAPYLADVRTDVRNEQTNTSLPTETPQSYIEPETQNNNYYTNRLTPVRPTTSVSKPKPKPNPVTSSKAAKVSPKSKPAAEAIVTNIVKSNKYNTGVDTAKVVFDKTTQLSGEGELGLYLFPKAVGAFPMAWLTD